MSDTTQRPSYNVSLMLADMAEKKATLVEVARLYDHDLSDVDEAISALKRVLETEISPELVPGSQKSEDSVGPYELQDFNLYYVLRFGYAPAKVAFLAWHAWRGKYRLPAIRKWLGVFLKRFFQNQFK